ncbi:MAG TPA: bifunctional hydroxymethylpyrimidine kinase/phosphomethylpyrimidine kinase [Chloroflexota bacterium]|nr:bifunctional hydroxymethylpyrimidine kinase/phosphomethylpyrimidine kinase [Chloroflexota bacterium]
MAPPSAPPAPGSSLPPKALTVAGSDSGGGAGIQADLKTFQALGVYGASVITAITAQNTLGVQGAWPVEPDMVAHQLDSVLRDIGADAIKTGMLAQAATVEVIAERLRGVALVVDPVLVSTSGRMLLEPEAIGVLKQKLLPLTLVVTPNIPEAEALTGLADPRNAARALHDLGARYVVVKGGHKVGDADDLLFDGSAFHVFPGERIDTPHTHGTGCTFSAAITAGLARGLDVPAAVARAKRFITAALRQAQPIGGGISPVNHAPADWDE